MDAAQKALVTHLQAGIVQAKRAAMSGLPVNDRPASVLLFPAYQGAHGVYLTVRFVGREGATLPAATVADMPVDEDWLPRQGDLLIMLTVAAMPPELERIEPLPFLKVLPVLRDILLGRRPQNMPELSRQRTILILSVPNALNGAIRRDELFFPAPPPARGRGRAVPERVVDTSLGKAIAPNQWDEIGRDRVVAMRRVLKHIRPQEGNYTTTTVYQWRPPVARLKWAGVPVAAYGRAFKFYQDVVDEATKVPGVSVFLTETEVTTDGAHSLKVTFHTAATNPLVGRVNSREGCFITAWRRGPSNAPALRVLRLLLHYYNITFLCTYLADDDATIFDIENMA